MVPVTIPFPCVIFYLIEHYIEFHNCDEFTGPLSYLVKLLF